MDKCTIIVTYNNGDKKQYIVDDTIDNIIKCLGDNTNTNIDNNIIRILQQGSIIYINMDNVNELKILKK